MTGKASHTQSKGLDMAALADIVDLLARIHEREVDAGFIDGWRSNGLTQWLAETLVSTGSADAMLALERALVSLPDPVDEAAQDDLASDYADIYLTHAYRISPNGSVWLTEEGLERQGPMFETRSWYRRYGVEVPDWRNRPDDNIVHQLQFLAHLLRSDNRDVLADAARFLDAGLLVWLPDFAVRVDSRARTPFYRAFARMTHAAVEEIRDRLEDCTGIGRAPARPAPQACASAGTPDATSYFPGQAESW